MSDISRYLQLYLRLGFSIIPLAYRSKKPLVEWSEYQRRKPNEKELRRCFIGRQVNIGVVCGAVSGYLTVLDFDDFEAYRRFFEDYKGLRTLVVKTARGVHVYFRSSNPVRSFKIPALSLDVKGEGSYVAAPPSIHPTGVEYKFIDEPWSLESIPLIQDLEGVIWARASELGVFRYGFADDPPCIRRILEGVEEGMRNECAVRLASYFLYFRRRAPEEAWMRLREWNLRNRPPLDEKELRSCFESVLRHGYEYGCTGMKVLGLCSPTMEEVCRLRGDFQVKKKITKYVPSAVLSDGRIIEEAYRDGRVFFIVYNPATGEVKEEDEVEGDYIYKPIMNADVETGQVLLPSGVEEYEDDKRLFDEVMSFLDFWHEQRDRWERELDVLYVFQTWVFDAFPQIPYRRALGRYGSGKTAWLETLGYICYRPMVLSGCDSEASLRRTFDLWRGTALIDEADFMNTTFYANIIKILNIGYSKAGWYRCCDENNPKRILSFHVYGPKLLATRTRFKDTALESRCLTFIARKGKGDAPLFRDKRFREEAQKIRNKLLLWRFRNLHRIMEKVKQLEERGLFRERFAEDIEQRVAQIILPLTILFEDERLIEKLRKTAQRKTEELRSLDPDSWLEEELPKAISRLIEASCELPKGTSRASGPSPIVGSFWLDELVEQLYGSGLESGERRSLSAKISRFLRDTYGAVLKRKKRDGKKKTLVLLRLDSLGLSSPTGDTLDTWRREIEEPPRTSFKNAGVAKSEDKTGPLKVDAPLDTDAPLGKLNETRRGLSLPEEIILAKQVSERFMVDGMFKREPWLRGLTEAGVRAPQKLLRFLRQNGWVYEPKEGWLKWLR